MKDFKFANGVTVKDKLTGFKGIIVGQARYLTGCDQYAVQPVCKDDDTGEIKKNSWFDEGRLEIVKGAKQFSEQDVRAEENGCDISPPSI